MAVIKKLYFTTGVDVTAPTDLTSESSTTHVGEYADDTAFVTANGAAVGGDLYINTTSKTLRLFTGTAWRSVVMSANAADPTKTFLIDATAATTATSATLAFANTVSRTYTFQDETGTVPVLPIDLGTEVTDQLEIPNGGTGQSTAAGAINALVPLQTGNVGKFLRTDGSSVSWDNAGGGGSGGGNPSGNVGGAGGGGGGGGGWVYLAYQTLAGPVVPNAISVSGGNGGNGSNGLGTGRGGNGGSGGTGGRIHIIDVFNNTSTAVVGVAGTAGATTVTIAGAVGGTGAVTESDL